MEFEQYLEQDIITFLDSKMTRKEKSIIDREEDYGIYLTKDYLKELSYALDNDELTKAKKLFDELKHHYDQMPKESIERKQVYSLLEKMFAKIEQYTQLHGRNMRESNNVSSGTASSAPATVSFNAVLNNPLSKPLNIPLSAVTNPLPTSVIAEKVIIYNGDTMGANVRAPQVRFEDISNNNVFTASARIKNVRDAESQQAPQVQYISGTRGSRRVNTDANIETKELLNNALSEFKSLRDELLERVLAEVDRHIANNAEYTDKRLETYTDTRLEMLRKDILKEINMHNAGAHDVRAPHDAYAPDNARAPDRLPDADLKHDTELNNSFNTLNNSFNTDTLRLDIHRKAHGAAAHMPAARVPDVRVFNDVRPAALRKPGHLKSKPQDSRNIMRKLYEEAVYTMYQNNYPEAAKLFKAITDYYPDNKAARIRLQECMEASGNA